MAHKVKTIAFITEEQLKLWEWLQKLPHGKFSQDTMAFWTDKMKESEKK
jgi:hypothetical protein